MSVPDGIAPELQIAWEQAYSSCDLPAGEYLGSVDTGSRTYYFYKKGPDYLYQTDYDREMELLLKKRRDDKRWKDRN
ncbi:hypothetical protein ACOAOT_23705 [Lacrimispora sp. AGF001]|uniref:hypothetical protein n=1 Tax=Lacrimispora sp. AGF001 TaxID=3401631 RepID=UPI003B42A68F